MKMTHIILSTKKLDEAIAFYESHFKIMNKGRGSNLSFRFGDSILGFKDELTYSEASSSTIEHLGIEVETRKEVDDIYSYFKSLILQQKTLLVEWVSDLIAFILPTPMAIGWSSRLGITPQTRTRED